MRASWRGGSRRWRDALDLVPSIGDYLVLIVRGVLQWPSLNINAETFADVSVYKSMSLVDTFPIGDPEVLEVFLLAQYQDAPFVNNPDITTVFARNIVSYFNTTQQALTPQ